MKSQLFKTAWILFKKYEISFSTALKDAWKLTKRELLKVEFSKTDVKDFEKRNSLLNLFNSLKPNTFLNKARAFDYKPFKIESYESWMH